MEAFTVSVVIPRTAAGGDLDVIVKVPGAKGRMTGWRTSSDTGNPAADIGIYCKTGHAPADFADRIFTITLTSQTDEDVFTSPIEWENRDTVAGAITKFMVHAVMPDGILENITLELQGEIIDE